MKVRAVVYVIAAVLVAAFFVANWDLLRGPVTLNLLIARVETPLALLLLLCAGIVLAINGAAHALAEHSWRAERRQLAADVARLRAERAELDESRSQGLRTTVEREFAAIRAQLERVVSGVQRLENDTMDAPPLPSPPSAIEPELIPPRPVAGRG